MALRFGREFGRRLTASLPMSLDVGVGVPERVGLLSPDLFSKSNAVRGALSGDRSGDLEFPRQLLRSLTAPVFCIDCMRLWYWPLIKDFSGDLLGIGLTVYTLSRALAANASAAAATFAEVFGLVTGLDVLGLSGNGGGARSGSELSHLCFEKRSVSFIEP